MSKILVVTYSYTGTCRRLTQLLCSQQGWPSAEILEQKQRSGASGTWRCILDSWLRRHPKIRYAGPDPKNFDAVVLVSPVWAYRLASPMRSFVSLYRKSLPDVAVVSVMGGRGAQNAIAEISQIIGYSPILSAAFTAREICDGSCASRLQVIGDAVGTREDTQFTIRPTVWSPQAT